MNLKTPQFTGFWVIIDLVLGDQSSVLFIHLFATVSLCSLCLIVWLCCLVFLVLVSSEVFRAELVKLMADLVGPRLYSCCNCRNHVSLHDDIVSKAFQGKHGRAFLFSHAMNIVVGAKEDRHLMTGLHTVADISCGDCHEVLGWKYERAYEASQKYKEGKFIFEKSKIVKEGW